MDLISRIFPILPTWQWSMTMEGVNFSASTAFAVAVALPFLCYCNSARRVIHGLFTYYYVLAVLYVCTYPFVIVPGLWWEQKQQEPRSEGGPVRGPFYTVTNRFDCNRRNTKRNNLYFSYCPPVRSGLVCNREEMRSPPSATAQFIFCSSIRRWTLWSESNCKSGRCLKLWNENVDWFSPVSHQHVPAVSVRESSPSHSSNSELIWLYENDRGGVS